LLILAHRVGLIHAGVPSQDPLTIVIGVIETHAAVINVLTTATHADLIHAAAKTREE
jgi:hypothetical protein